MKLWRPELLVYCILFACAGCPGNNDVPKGGDSGGGGEGSTGGAGVGGGLGGDGGGGSDGSGGSCAENRPPCAGMCCPECSTRCRDLSEVACEALEQEDDPSTWCFRIYARPVGTTAPAAHYIGCSSCGGGDAVITCVYDPADLANTCWELTSAWVPDGWREDSGCQGKCSP